VINEHTEPLQPMAPPVTFTAKVLKISVSLYIFSYLLLSWRGKADSYSYDGLVWSFQGTKMSSLYYFPSSSDFKPKLLETERRMCLFYRPLIQLDARLTKDKYIYYEIATECGK
jgi:hypothetical protein